jgi:hypothetical protein
VRFRGEVDHDERFADGEKLPTPKDGDGEAMGNETEDEPTWLSFTYSIGDYEREVLVDTRNEFVQGG